MAEEKRNNQEENEFEYIDDMDFDINEELESHENEIKIENEEKIDNEEEYNEIESNSEVENIYSEYEENKDNKEEYVNIEDIVSTAQNEVEQNDITSYSTDKQRENMEKQEKKEMKRYRKTVRKRKKEKAGKNKVMFRLVWLAMVLVIGSVLGTFLVTGLYDFLAIDRQNSEETEVLITIPKDASLDEVTEILEENGVINEPFFFKTYATITNSTEGFLPGTYKIETNLDYEALLNQLLYNSGPQEYVTVQFTEGLTVMEYAQILDENNVCDSKEFLEACNSDMFDEDYDFIAEIGEVENRVYKLEGYLFPDTYIFYLNEDVENVVSKFLDNFNKKVIKNTKKYSGYTEEMSIKEYADLKEIKLDDLINMASLAQAEASDDQDMYSVTSVFYNRLATEATGGVSYYGDYEVNKLQSDATIYYPYSSEEDIPKDIKKTFKSDYNTYDIVGLPPGPICNPGLVAIDAALNPKDTDYYYFCHKAATDTEPAEAYYAYTMTEHQENLEKAGLVD